MRSKAARENDHRCVLVVRRWRVGAARKPADIPRGPVLPDNGDRWNPAAGIGSNRTCGKRSVRRPHRADVSNAPDGADGHPVHPNLSEIVRRDLDASRDRRTREIKRSRERLLREVRWGCRCRDPWCPHETGARESRQILNRPVPACVVRHSGGRATDTAWPCDPQTSCDGPSNVPPCPGSSV